MESMIQLAVGTFVIAFCVAATVGVASATILGVVMVYEMLRDWWERERQQ
jgi:hypothetical protein